MNSRSASRQGADQKGRPAPKPPRARGRLVLVKTHAGTTQTFIFYNCSACGSQHRVTEYGIRVTACRNGLVFVTAGGAR